MRHLDVLDLPEESRDLIRECEATGARTVFERAGRPVAILVSYDEYQAMHETLDIANDALRELVRTGDFYGYVFEGRRYDAGEKLGYLKATVDYALKHPDLGRDFRAYLQTAIGS